MELEMWNAFASAHGCNPEEEEDSDKIMYQAYQRGSDCYQAGNYKGAAEAWSQALEVDPDDPHALWQRGAAKEHMGDVDGAIQDYSESLRIDSSASQAGVFF